MYIHEIQLRVRYAETDKMGVVYHGNYAQYFEVARVEMLRSVGVSYSSMEDSGIMLPVVNLNIDFRKPALYDELLRVKTTLKDLPGVRIHFDYELFNQKDELLANASTDLVFVDMENKRPKRCPDYLLEKLETYFEGGVNYLA
jgi:acyl-CoA thioester hydrolase